MYYCANWPRIAYFVLQYRSNVSWQSQLDPWNPILASRMSRRSSFEKRESRIENQGSSIENPEKQSFRICKLEKNFEKTIYFSKDE